MAPKLSNIEIVILVGSTVAFLSTLTRIILRRRRLWVDDAWAFFSALALVVQLVAVFLCPPHGSPAGVVRYYLLATSFTVIIWSARLSLLFSLIRVDPQAKRRRVLHYVAAVYVILCILLIFQLVWICQAQPKWKTLPVPQCHLGWQIALFQLITDVVADGSLLITPLLQFRIITDKALRTRLGAIFSTCIITTVASLVHAVFVLTSTGVQVEMAGIVEACASLIVCNIPVIATALLRLQISTSRPLLTTLLSTIMFHSDDELQETQDSPPLG